MRTWIVILLAVLRTAGWWTVVGAETPKQLLVYSSTGRVVYPTNFWTGSSNDVNAVVAGRMPTGGTNGQSLVKASSTDWDVTWATVSGGAGVTDHGALTGLADDDHTQYHNNTRGDARYAPLSHNQPLSTITNAGTAASWTVPVTGNANSTNVVIGTDTRLSLATDIQRFGFVDNTQTSIGFDGTNTFTLTDAGSGWSYYRSGIRYAISGSKTVTLTNAPPAPATVYYIYIDGTDGALTASTSAWTLNDTIVPVATVAWNSALTPKYWLADERHTCLIDRRVHRYEHFSEGTKYVEGGTLASYSVAPVTPADTNNTFSISAVTLADEDLFHTLDALAWPNGTATDYVVAYKTNGVWNWKASAMPYRYSTGGYIQYDSAGTMTQGGSGSAYNSYLLFSNLSGAARFIVIHGRSEFASTNTAYAESVMSLDLTGLPIAETVIAYQLTWTTSAAYGTKGKCRLARTPQRISVSVTSVTSPSSADHNSLSGLQGGASGDYYHLTGAQATDLTDGGETTLHSHAGGSGGGAPTNLLYIVAEASTALNNERVLTNGAGLTWTDGGAGGLLTLAPDFGTAAGKVTQGNDARLSQTTTRGDINVRGASADGRLAVGALGAALMSDGTDPLWLSPRTGLYFVQDFLTWSTTATTTQFDPWQAAGSSGSIATLSGTAKHPGIIRVGTGTSAGGTETIGCPSATVHPFLAGYGTLYHAALVRIPTASDGTETFSVRHGFGNSPTDVPTDGVYLEYTHNTNSGRWLTWTAKASSWASQDSGLTVTNNVWTLLEVTINAAGSEATFAMTPEGGETTTVTDSTAAHIPTAGMSHMVQIMKRAGTTVRYVEVDLAMVWFKPTSNRW